MHLLLWIFCIYSTFQLSSCQSDPLFQGNSPACFASCISDDPSYSVSVTTSNSTSVALFCDNLLTKVYNGCTSFAISTARCNRGARCRTECSVTDWCYFSVGMVANCPGGTWSAPVGDATWMLQQCQTAETNYTSTYSRLDATIDNETGNSTSSKTSGSALSHLFTDDHSWQTVGIVAGAWIGIAVLVIGLVKLVKYCVDGDANLSLLHSTAYFRQLPTDDYSSAGSDAGSSRYSSSSGSRMSASGLSMMMEGDDELDGYDAYRKNVRRQQQQPKGSFYKSKFAQWTGARRKRDEGGQYELTLTNSIRNSVNSDDVADAPGGGEAGAAGAEAVHIAQQVLGDGPEGASL